MKLSSILNLTLAASLMVFLACGTKDIKSEPTPQTDTIYFKEKVEAVIRSHFSDFQECYRKALETNPKLNGRIEVAWDFDSKGHVLKVTPNRMKSSITNEDLINCVSSKIYAWKFPAGSAGTYSVDGHPFEFKPDAKDLKK